MSDIEVGKQTGPSLREMLAHYDRRVGDSFREVTGATTGTGRVQALHVLRRVLSAHDSVVGSTLCPLLQDLPGGPEVADRLRHGCEERASLLSRFQSLVQGTAAHNVYPVFGADIETILAELRRSFDQHVEDETTRVSELLDAAAASIAPEVVAAKMAIEASRTPARAHRMTHRHPTSKALRTIYRGIDRMHDWNDSHHGWPSSTHRPARPVRPARRFERHPPAILALLSRYDETVDSVIAELAEAEPGRPDWAAAAYRMSAAVTVHDSIVGGTLCQVLGAVPEGRAAAARLREGCRERAALLEEWNDLVTHASPSELVATHPVKAKRIVEELVASFRAHEAHETDDVAAVIEQLRQRTWRRGGTGLVSLAPDVVWPNPEPEYLAAHMALWAETAPTHPHRLLARHPANRLLRGVYRRADQIRDWRRSRRGWPTLT